MVQGSKLQKCTKVALSKFILSKCTLGKGGVGIMMQNPPLCSRNNLTYISSYGPSFRNVLAALLKCILSKYTLAKGIILSVVSQWLRRRVPESWLPAGDSLLPDPVPKQLKALKTAD